MSMSLTLRTTRRIAAARPLAFSSSYHGTPRALLANRLPDPRQTLSPRTDEYTKSGHDDDVAALKDAPYCRNKSRPEDELVAAALEAAAKHITNPLETSAANTDISKPSSDMLTGAYVGIKWEGVERQRSRYGGTPGKGEKLRVWKTAKKIKLFR